MILSKTPLRMSFTGGGSDLPDYYNVSGMGAVLSTTINKYIYINVKTKFDSKIRLSYSQTEIVDDPSQIQHELVRECLLASDVLSSVEITSIADIPSNGTGLGSSSSYTVGLLKSLSTYTGNNWSIEDIAKTACNIEMNILNHPIGKQDQYSAAYGGLNYIQFNSDNSVIIEPISISSGAIIDLFSNIIVFYTGISRPSDSVLTRQKENTRTRKTTRAILDKMVEQTITLREYLEKDDLSVMGDILNEGWQLKKKLCSNIATDSINLWYNIAMKNGALGGKILGAGGGGFLMLYAPKSEHEKIKLSLSNLRYIPINYERNGTQIVYHEKE